MVHSPVMLVAEVAFGDSANGSLVVNNSKTVGSDLIGQGFTRPVLENGEPKKDPEGNPVVEASPAYFQSCPSAAGTGTTCCPGPPPTSGRRTRT